jgi:hypothetical protein
MPTFAELRAIASAPNNLLGQLPRDLLRMVGNMGEREELSRVLSNVPDQDLRARIWESIMSLVAIIERSDTTGYHAPAAEKFESTYNHLSVDVRTLLQRFVEGQAGPVTKANCQAIINKYRQGNDHPGPVDQR